MERKIICTQPIIDRYGVINGDNDIIHYDHDYAVQRGFRGPIAHGLMVMGYAVEMAVRKWGKDFYHKGEIDVRFVGPAIPDDEVVVNIGDDGALVATVPAGNMMVGTIGLRQG
jgi:3-hydroxybutyryl-CoA dehydratase